MAQGVEQRMPNACGDQVKVVGPTAEEVERARVDAPSRKVSAMAEVIGTAMIGLGKVLEPEKYELQHVEAQVPEDAEDDDNGDLLKRISFGAMDPLW